MAENSDRSEASEGTWVDDVIIFTGKALGELGGGDPQTLVGSSVVDSAGTSLGKVVRVTDAGPSDLPEAYVVPTEDIYERIGSERGNNNLGFPAEEIVRDDQGQLRLPVTVDELFERNEERGGTPENLSVKEQLGL